MAAPVHLGIAMSPHSDRLGRAHLASLINVDPPSRADELTLKSRERVRNGEPCGTILRSRPFPVFQYEHLVFVEYYSLQT